MGIWTLRDRDPNVRAFKDREPILTLKSNSLSPPSSPAGRKRADTGRRPRFACHWVYLESLFAYEIEYHFNQDFLRAT